MTVSYNLDVSHTSLAGFLKLQLRWRGSIWKSVLLELFFFCMAFFILSFLYRSDFVLTEEGRKFWDDLAALFDSKMDYIPLTFMLGFFVTIIVNRWIEIFNNVGWIDPTALVMATYLRGSDEKSRMLRRNTIRYMVLTQVLVYRDISMQVKRRFPSLETIVASGLMTDDEMISLNDCSIKYSKYFLPIQWAFNILYEARVGGKIAADLMLNEIMKNILDFRKGLAQLTNFDWVPIPLVYPQVVFLAVRSYFFIALIGRQSVLIDGSPPNPYHPAFPLVPFIMTALQYIFYVGWMKVAESLMNPLGEDDDDFECNFLIDRNLQMGLAIVDETYNSVPPQQKDIFWSERVAEPLYSADSATKKVCPQVGSAVQFEAEDTEVLMVPHESHEGMDEMEIDGENERLLPRVVSVPSVRGSKLSLNSRKRSNGFLGSLRKQFSRDSRVSRPSRLGLQSSQTSLNTPNVELAGGSAFNILDELAAESANKDRSTTPSTRDSIILPSPRWSPSPAEQLTSVAEEDEENQRTLRANELIRLKIEADKEMSKDPQ